MSFEFNSNRSYALVNIATQRALDLSRRDNAESTFARLNGITSVPFFIINNQIRVDGSHSVEVFLQALNRAAFLEVSTDLLKL